MKNLTLADIRSKPVNQDIKSISSIRDERAGISFNSIIIDLPSQSSNFNGIFSGNSKMGEVETGNTLFVKHKSNDRERLIGFGMNMPDSITYFIESASGSEIKIK